MGPFILTKFYVKVIINVMKRQRLIAIIITFILLGLVFYKINWVELIQTFKLFNAKYLLPIILSYVLSLYIRGIRWKFLLLNDTKYSSLELAEVFTAGSMLNVFLPARAGDVYRAYYLGKIKHEKKMKIFGSVILERVFDGLAVFFILLAAVFLYCKEQWIINITYAVGALFIGCLVMFYLIFRFNKIDYATEKIKGLWNYLPDKISDKLCRITDKLFGYANSFVCGFEVLDNVKYSILVFIYSMIIWLLECLTACYVIMSFDLGLGISAGMFVISLTSFSSMIPSTSIFLGPYQYAYILAMKIFGVGKSAALAISAVHQGFLILILLVLGGICLLKFNYIKKCEKQ